MSVKKSRSNDFWDGPAQNLQGGAGEDDFWEDDFPEDDFMEDDFMEDDFLDDDCPAGSPDSADAPQAPAKIPESASNEGKKKKLSLRNISKKKLLTAAAVLLAAITAIVLIFSSKSISYVAAIDLEHKSLSVFTGEATVLTPDITVIGAGKPSLKWTSTDSAVATVDQQGEVTGITAGEAVITVRDLETGRSDTCVVLVHNVNDMVLDVSELTLGAGESRALTVQMGAQGEGQPEFASSDESVAAVDAAGRVTAAAPGTAVITVTARGFTEVSCPVTVKAAPTVMEPGTSGEMCLGEARLLTVSMSDLEFSSSLTYASADPAVVSVDQDGLMTAAAEGTTTVTATAHNGAVCTLSVTVGRAPGSVSVEKKTVYNGRPVNLGAADDTGNCRQFYYTSSDPSVLTVDEDGTLHAHKRGTATVTCTSYNGKSDTCEVTARIVDYTTPYTSDVVYQNIDALAASYPDIIATESIGTSVQGRDITLLKLGTGERKVLVVAGMHSKESIGVTFTMRCIEEYAQAMSAGTYLGRYDVRALLSEYTIYFVPLLNPDGMDIYMGIEQPEYTDQLLTQEELDEFKNNANGVNLNRNFPFEWGYEGVNTTAADGRSYAGASEASEPETQAIIALCEANEFEWMFNVHCKGHMIFYQDKVNEVTQQSNNIAARLAGRCDFVLNDRSTLYEISGGFENWFRRQYGKAGICVEIVPSEYSTAVNEYFERKTLWDVTQGIFLMCLGQ